MLAAVHARDAIGTKAHVTHSQLAHISRPSTIYTYISNSCGRIFEITPFGINCKMSKNSFKQIFCVDKSIYKYLFSSQDRVWTYITHNSWCELFNPLGKVINPLTNIDNPSLLTSASTIPPPDYVRVSPRSSPLAFCALIWNYFLKAFSLIYYSCDRGSHYS